MIREKAIWGTFMHKYPLVPSMVSLNGKHNRSDLLKPTLGPSKRHTAHIQDLTDPHLWLAGKSGSEMTRLAACKRRPLRLCLCRLSMSLKSLK